MSSSAQNRDVGEFPAVRKPSGGKPGPSRNKIFNPVYNAYYMIDILIILYGEIEFNSSVSGSWSHNRGSC